MSMARKLVHLSLAVLFIAALAALLVNTQSLAAQSKDKDKDNDRDDRGVGNLVIAQLSDMHIGLGSAPDASANLRRAVQMINQRNVDAVIITGDVGERPDAWKEAREILGGLKAKYYMVPGNHDVHTKD